MWEQKATAGVFRVLRLLYGMRLCLCVRRWGGGGSLGVPRVLLSETGGREAGGGEESCARRSYYRVSLSCVVSRFLGVCLLV